MPSSISDRPQGGAAPHRPRGDSPGDISAKKNALVARALAAAGDWTTLAAQLMRDHYDPRYLSHRARHAGMEIAEIALASLDDAAQEVAAARVEAVLASPRFTGWAGPASPDRGR